MFTEIRKYQVWSEWFCNLIRNKTSRKRRCSPWDKKVFSRDQKRGICARISGCLLFIIYWREISLIWKNRLSFFEVFELFMFVEIEVKATTKWKNFIRVGAFFGIWMPNSTQPRQLNRRFHTFADRKMFSISFLLTQSATERHQSLFMNTVRNKKVLLRERKRHTVRRVESTHSVSYLGWPPPPAGPRPPPHWLDLTPPASWTCPPPLPPPAGPDPPGWTWPTPLPPAGWTWPPPAGPDPPPCQLDLTPPRLDQDPPPPVNKLTKWNYYLPVVLRTRAVISKERRDWHILAANDHRIISHNLNR